ncbi:uncharacterized protein [Pyrus communis]|uniref:uncharacterized protein n=1 Tax=Pyrus communis TaxID=23211 RepID=UPI0035BFC669
MGDRRRRSLTMQMAQYQVSLAIADAKMNHEEAEFVNSLMQYEHHVESRYCHGRSFVQHDREECHDQMMKDYFIEHPRHPPHDFWKWYRMRRELFESILNAVVHHGYYFARKIDAVDNTAIVNLKCFCKAIKAIYEAIYLRKSNREYLKMLLRKADKEASMA